MEHHVTDATRVKDNQETGAGRAYAAVLAECRELIRSRACAAISDLRTALEEDIEERIISVLDPDEEKMLADLRGQLQNGGDTLERSFANAFDHSFGELSRKRQGKASNLYQEGGSSDIELSLVDDEVFAEALTVKGQANVLYGACEGELKDLLPRFALMLGNASELDAADNPGGPEAVSEALKEACWAIECPRPAKELLFEIMTRKLAPQLKSIYHDVNQHLIVRRVLPTITRTGVKRGGIEKKNTSKRQRTPEVETETPDVLRQLLQSGGNSEGLAHAFGHAGLAHQAHANPGMMQMLTRLQQGENEVEFGDTRFSVDATAAATMNVLHGLLDAGVGKHLGPVDNIVIDVVATLFDFIFDDQRVPEAMKGLIGRMQLPVLKLALADHSFFSNRNHAARRLINAMAQSASTWDGELTPESSLYKAAEPLVLRIQNEACEDSAVFAACLETFETFLADQERQADQKAATLTNRLTVREQLEIAHTVAEGAIAGYVADDGVPDVVRQLLANHWLGVLTEAARNGGEDGNQWRDCVAIMDDLVWSIRPKYGAEERQKLVKLLPRLLGGLKAKLDGIEVDAAVREAFFTELVKLHSIAIRAGMVAPTTPADSTDSTSEPAAHVPAQAAPLPRSAPVAPEPEADELQDLQRGTWIELCLESGERRAVRLTWISPARTLYLFANRQGQRALALPRADLARKFNAGEAVLVDDEPLMDRLVADALDDYKPGQKT